MEMHWNILGRYCCNFHKQYGVLDVSFSSSMQYVWSRSYPGMQRRRVTESTAVFQPAGSCLQDPSHDSILTLTPFGCRRAHPALAQRTRCTEAIGISTMRPTPPTAEGCTRSQNCRRNSMSVTSTRFQWGCRAVRRAARGPAVVASTPESSRPFESGRSRPEPHVFLP